MSRKKWTICVASRPLSLSRPVWGTTSDTFLIFFYAYISIIESSIMLATMILNMTMMMDEDDGWGWWRLWRQRFWVDGVDNRQSGTFYLPRACFLSPVVTLRTHSLFSITINIVGFLIFGREWGGESNHYFQFGPMVTFSRKSRNFSNQATVDWISIEKL